MATNEVRPTRRRFQLEVLARYEVITANGVVGALCRRCPTVLITARNVDGDQRGLTLAEVAEQAVDHELEAHS
ncbi:MAG TPA: hypothetical protein VF163_03630 [Micromonosporaceae bacterium]